MERNLIHTFWPRAGENIEDDEDENEEDEEYVNIHELEYADGSNENVKSFNQKCVIFLEQDSDYRFKQCGDKYICGECYKKKVILI